jgi:hypothetical protein
MTLDQMIVWLQEFKQSGVSGTAKVCAWDPDAQESLPITGAILSFDRVDLHTDDID